MPIVQPMRMVILSNPRTLLKQTITLLLFKHLWYSTCMKIAFPQTKKTVIAIVLLCLAAGAAGGTFITRHILLVREKTLLTEVRPVRIHNNKYHFTNPLIGYSIPYTGEFSEFNPLEKKINDSITAAKQNNQASNVSVYFRDLNLGRWTGVNENEQYDPASMLKVVIMMAFYKEAGSNPAILDQKITYTQAINELISEVPNQTPSLLQTGKQYTIEQLIEAMIMDSDNGAKNALLSNLDNDSLNEVFTDLGIQAPQDDHPYTISAKSYTLFFRVLYNSTYLSEDYSEKALDLLSKTSFADGLNAGVPKDVEIAHKFGQHVNNDALGNMTDQELHDCGIIFHPEKPYVLCVMTRGKDIHKLFQVIKGISKQVYDSVDSKYKK
jgi:beta-lactamase class A